MTQAKLGAGSQLKLGDGETSEVFTLIAEVLRVGAVGQTTGEVDVTSLDSTSKEYIASLPDGEPVSFQLNFIAGNTQHQDLRDAVGTTRNFQQVWSDGSEAEFAMVVLGFMRDETTPEGQLTATLNGRITGDIDWS